MTTTLSSMRDEVKLAFGNRTDLDTLIDAWLNQSQLALATVLRIRELELAATLTLVASPVTDIYAQPIDFLVPVLMVNTSQNRQEIKLKPINNLLIRERTPVSPPSEYGIRGKTFVFRPAPDATDIVELTYRFRPATMTASVDLSLPDEFRPVTIFEAIARGMYIIGQEDRAKFFVDHRDRELRNIGDQRGEEIYSREEGARVMWSGIEGFRGLCPR